MPVKKKSSLKFVMGYAYRECGSITLGMFYLVGGSVSDLLIPMFIGRVIDYINNGEYDKIGTVCQQMVVVVIVSSLPHPSPLHSHLEGMNDQVLDSQFLAKGVPTRRSCIHMRKLHQGPLR